MRQTLEGWISNAWDRALTPLDSPVGWILIVGLVAAAVWSSTRQHWNIVRWIAYGTLGVWLLATVGITLEPTQEPTFEGIGDRLDVQSVIPLAGTIDSFASMGTRVMSPEEVAALTDKIATDLDIPVDEVNLSPVVSGPSLSTVLRDPVGNVLLFVPLGLLAPFALHVRRWSKAVWIGAAISGVIELTQLLVAWGSLGTIDDVIFNTLGAVTGYGLWRGAVRLREGLL
ncbi:MAG: VanZ family protein [Acidimicrobiia bacterium]|nr:VanZ family protein [Acidimicrobiia bacterium]